MKEIFKHKKVIVTGCDGFKSTWLKELLNEWGAQVIDTSNIQNRDDIKETFTVNQPEIVFHFSSLQDVERDASVRQNVISPYMRTSHILDAMRGITSIKSAIVIPADKIHEDKEWSTGLDEDEKKEFVNLLEKVDNIQIRGEIWHQLVKKFITVPIELCILDDQDKVFLVYRKDREFDGYHMPGTVVNDWETVKEARLRLVNGEVIRDAGFQVSEPEPIGWIEVRRGDGAEENKTRNAVSLLHVSRLQGDFQKKEGIGFFAFDSLPENTLGCHKFLLRKFAQYLEDGEAVLGE